MGHPVCVPTFLPIRIESIARSIRSANRRAHASTRVARVCIRRLRSFLGNTMTMNRTRSLTLADSYFSLFTIYPTFGCRLFQKIRKEKKQVKNSSFIFDRLQIFPLFPIYISYGQLSFRVQKIIIIIIKKEEEIVDAC